MSLLENRFQLSEHNTDAKTEIIAGITTFMTMAYIIAVHPAVMSSTGMPFGALLTATCLSSAIGCFLMAAFANYPFALAPGMGINAYFAYTVVLSMGISWQVALTAVFAEGIIFILLTLTNIRQKVVNAIPTALKIGISAGIGLYIAFIGLTGAKIVVPNQATLLSLTNSFTNNPTAFLTLIGLMIMTFLQVKRVKGAILIGIIIVTILGIPCGVTKLPESFFSAPPSLSPIFFKMDFSQLGSLNFWVVVFAFFFVDFFDTVGCLVGLASRVGMLDEQGSLPKASGALMADAIATAAGAALGTSTVTTFIESASGIEEGGRTGLTAATAGVLFLLAMFLNPLIAIIPSCATSPALIMVGCFMLMGLGKMDFSDWTEFLPALLAFFMMPFAYSIATGIEFGITSYVILKLCTGKGKDVNWLLYVLAVLFILNHALR